MLRYCACYQDKCPGYKAVYHDSYAGILRRPPEYISPDTLQTSRIDTVPDKDILGQLALFNSPMRVSI